MLAFSYIMKKEVKKLNATPPKEIYRSIIVDYNITLGICELVDNAIDIWSKKGSKTQLDITIDLDDQQQKIVVTDNAGGIGEKDILLFVSPGRTSNTATEETIGLFGVGSKRAVVALAKNIKMRTRKGNAKTFQVEYDDDWLKEDSWLIPMYEVDKIDPKTTRIELLGLRSSIKEEIVNRVKEHLAATYALFLKKGNLNITVNKEAITGIEFDNEWAYPPKYAPARYKFDLLVEGDVVKVEILGGVIGEHASRGGESGVYFYCNERLIAKALKDYDVGYSPGNAGRPHHPGAALGRVVVKLQGQAQYMPWNSSKSAINYQHKVYEAIRESVITALSYYVGLSRRTQGDWPGQIYKYQEGEILEKPILQPEEVKDIYGIPLPKTRKRYEEKLSDKNKSLARKKPWIIGLYEAIAAVDIISKKSFRQKYRFALIMLDSNLEIGLKEYLVNEAKIGNQKFKKIIENRADVITEVRKHTTAITENQWQRINYYYNMRNNLVHQKASPTVLPEDVEEYRKLIQLVLKELFGLKF